MTDQEKILELEGERDMYMVRCNSNTELWIGLGHKLGLNSKEGPVDIDGIINYCVKLKEHNDIDYPDEKISPHELPKYVKMGHVILIFRKLDGEYHKCAGNWSVGYKWVDGNLLSDSPYDTMNNIPLIPSDIDSWEKDNEGYACDDDKIIEELENEEDEIPF